jgi:hypothetical protein
MILHVFYSQRNGLGKRIPLNLAAVQVMMNVRMPVDTQPLVSPSLSQGHKGLEDPEGQGINQLCLPSSHASFYFILHYF